MLMTPIAGKLRLLAFLSWRQQLSTVVLHVADHAVDRPHL
jgi:hypothetical protein